MQNSTNRRDFLKTTGGAALVAGLAGTTSLGRTTPASAANEAKSGRISVHYEWGTLKEVVCGIPYLRIPRKLPRAVYDYGPTEGIKFLEANPDKSLEEADPGIYKAVVEQMNAALAVLEKRGVKVHRPEPVNEIELHYQENLLPPSVLQIFPRDPMLVIGNRFIETELFMPMRRREGFGIRRALADRLAESNAQMVSMPVAVPTPEQEGGAWGPGPFIEGGRTSTSAFQATPATPRALSGCNSTSARGTACTRSD